MEKRILRAGLVLAILILLVVVSACVGWAELESDAVRRAVTAHELDERGVQVDDLIIRLSPGEFKADFGYAARIVWLVSAEYQRQYVEEEYFKVRDPERSYLFVQDITYDDSDNQARVGVSLYLGTGQLTVKELTLHKRGGSWRVISDGG